MNEKFKTSCLSGLVSTYINQHSHVSVLPSIFPNRRNSLTKKPRSTVKSTNRSFATENHRKPRKLYYATPMDIQDLTIIPEREDYVEDTSDFQPHGHDYLKTEVDQTSFNMVTVDPSLKEYIEKGEKAKEKLETLESMNDKCQILTLYNVKQNPKMFKYYTGFPSYDVFEALFNYLEPKAIHMKYPYGERTMAHSYYSEKFKKRPGRIHTLDLRDEFFVTLVLLRLGIPSGDMAVRFGIAESTFSSIFNAWVCLLSIELEKICKLPHTGNEQVPTADCFSEFSNIRIILDCTELFAETPSSLSAHKQLFSNYKHHSTIKFLVGINAGGAVTYISQMYGGRASDKLITNESCDLLNAHYPREKDMGDRGFTISEDLPPGVHLVMPSFKHKDKSQFSKEELKKNKKISEARVHIERVIRRIKQFAFLSKEMKLCQIDAYENIFKACGYLINFQDPLLKV